MSNFREQAIRDVAKMLGSNVISVEERAKLNSYGNMTPHLAAVDQRTRVLELEAAILDHISDGKHVGSRSERLRSILEPKKER